MSSRGAATLAVVRNTPRGREDTKVLKAELGKASASDNTAATWLDALSQIVPTSIIAGYSAILTALIAAIDKPTKQDPTPNQYAPIRIGLWASFVVIAFFTVWLSYRNQTSPTRPRKLPLEVWASTFAFAVWGAASPGSWVTVAFHIKTALQPVLLLAIAVIGALILSGIGQTLTTKIIKLPADAPR